MEVFFPQEFQLRGVEGERLEAIGEYGERESLKTAGSAGYYAVRVLAMQVVVLYHGLVHHDLVAPLRRICWDIGELLNPVGLLYLIYEGRELRVGCESVALQPIWIMPFFSSQHLPKDA